MTSDRRPPEATPERPICDVCGEEDSYERVYGKVEVCRSCYSGLEYRIDQLTHIMQLFLDGGRLESFVAQCDNAGIRPHPKSPVERAQRPTQAEPLCPLGCGSALHNYVCTPQRTDYALADEPAVPREQMRERVRKAREFERSKTIEECITEILRERDEWMGEERREGFEYAADVLRAMLRGVDAGVAQTESAGPFSKPLPGAQGTPPRTATQGQESGGPGNPCVAGGSPAPCVDSTNPRPETAVPAPSLETCPKCECPNLVEGSCFGCGHQTRGHKDCVSYATTTCMYLRDGSKIRIMRSDDSRGAAWLDRVTQATIETAIYPSPPTVPAEVLHSQECLEYAAKTRRAHCIAPCADAHRARTARVQDLESALRKLVSVDCYAGNEVCRLQDEARGLLPTQTGSADSKGGNG